MLKVRLKNFRSLVDTGDVELRPITILVGQNSSGKSTFARFFPLLRQSLLTRSQAPLLWFGDDVDFGNFKEVKTSFTNAQHIVISLDAVNSAQEHNYTYTGRSRIRELPSMGYEAHISGSEKRSQISKVIYSVGNDTVEIDFKSRSMKITALRLNGKNYSNKIDLRQLRASSLGPFLNLRYNTHVFDTDLGTGTTEDISDFLISWGYRQLREL
jgi:AAA15 family ATPase/GTPase